MAETVTTVDATDIRTAAMAKEWCRMLNKDPDQMIRGLRGKEPRYRGYMRSMRRLLTAAHEALPFR